MASKRDFNAEEWAQIVNAPALAALRVVAAERGGTLRETLSMGRAYAEARQHADLPLLKEIAFSPPTMDPAQVSKPEDLSAHATSGLRDALRALEGRASPEELEDYKRFTMWVAETVARAHKEGGFLGVGGKEVSEREQAALDEIRAALDAPAG
jgi:hypothetical protein